MKYLLLFGLLNLNSTASKGQTAAQKIDRFVMNYANQGLFNGSILVAQKGNVIYKKGVGFANMEWKIPNTTSTKFRLGSITKQFTSMIIMQLVNEGKIKLEGHITDYLPHYRKETGDKITIHHLLSHSSGIPNYTDINNFWGKEDKKHFSVADFIRLFCSGDLEFEPGSRFSYSNSGYFILGAIIEAATKMPYHEALQKRILDVVGMTNTGYDFSEKIIANRAGAYEKTMDGYINAPYIDMDVPYAAGSLFSTVEDLHLWDRILYTNKLLPDSLKQKLFVPYHSLDAGSAEYAGYGWFTAKQNLPLAKKELQMIWHTGGIPGFLTTINRYPEQEILIVVLDNSSQSVGETLATPILEILQGAHPPLPKPGLATALHKKLMTNSVNDAVIFFDKMTAGQLKQYDLTGTEQQINRWGYTYLRDKKNAEDAIKLFALNVKLFPSSSNVYDSYGEALMEKGDYENAIANYKKSYAMDSTNTRALRMVAEMSSKHKQDTIRVTVDGHAMDLFVSGNNGPVIILEAGGASDHRCWNSIVPQLAKFARVVTYDRPGYLNSVACNRPRTAERVAEELKAALTKANIQGPYIIGGWSWGGAFAKVFANKYAHEVKGLLLVDPALTQVYDRWAAEFPDEFTQTVYEIPKINYAAENEFSAMMPTMHQGLVADQNFTGKTYLLIAGSYKDWKDWEWPLKKIWIEELEKYAKQRKHVQYEIVDSGHYIQREKPEVVIEAIKKLAF